MLLLDEKIKFIVRLDDEDYSNIKNNLHITKDDIVDGLCLISPIALRNLICVKIEYEKSTGTHKKHISFKFYYLTDGDVRIKSKKIYNRGYMNDLMNIHNKIYDYSYSFLMTREIKETYFYYRTCKELFETSNVSDLSFDQMIILKMFLDNHE